MLSRHCSERATPSHLRSITLATMHSLPVGRSLAHLTVKAVRKSGEMEEVHPLNEMGELIDADYSYEIKAEMKVTTPLFGLLKLVKKEKAVIENLVA